MRLRLRILDSGGVAAGAVGGPGSELHRAGRAGSLDRDALTTIAGRLANAVMGQDYAALQADLLPEEASQWEGIRAAVDQGAALVKGGQFQLRESVSAGCERPDCAADTQFFCSNATGR